MATWQREEHGTWTCPKCGNVYHLTCQRYPAKDQINLACQCGATIYRGNSTHDYDKEFLRKGDPKDAKNNPPL